MKVTILLIAVLIIACSAKPFIAAEMKQEVQQTDMLKDVSVGNAIFNAARQYWNGVVNGYNNWSKTYEIGEWCMGDDFQKEFGVGIFTGFFRLVTLQYVNMFQFAQDLSNAYNHITGQLDYCKGSKVVDDTHDFVYETFFWYEVGAVVTAFITNLGEFLASIPLVIFNIFNGDVKTVGYIHGKLLKKIYDVAKTF